MQPIDRQVSQLSDRLAHKKLGSPILETGAGSGSCRNAMLGVIDCPRAKELTSYDLTDISLWFFLRAQQRL